MKKKEKKKDTKFHKTYGLASNLSYIVKEMWKYDKITLVVVGFYGFFTPIAAYLWTFMSKFVIDIVTRKDDIKKLIGIIFITFIIQLVCTLCQSWSWGQWWRPISVRLSVLIQKNIKFMKLPYEYLEDKDTMDCYEKAVRTTDDNKKGCEGMIHLLENGAADIFTVIVGLFIIGTLSAPIMLGMAVLAFISFLIKDHTNRVVKERIWDPLATWWRKDEYLSRTFSDFAYAKDIRMYSLKDYLIGRYKEVSQERLDAAKEDEFRWWVSGNLDGVIRAVALIGVYAWLLYSVINKNLTVGNFTLYLGSATTFFMFLGRLFDRVSEALELSREVDDFRSFMDLDEGEKEKGKSVPKCDSYEFTFEDVWFKYPKAESYALKGLNLTVKAGEKLAVVGLNGAGKSTFIKLLLKLYVPTKGRILLNGVDISGYDRDEYYKIFSPVFQDVWMFAFPLKANVSMLPVDDTDDELAKKCLADAGMAESVDKLPDGVNTEVLKVIYDEGVDFSGGEKQKIALAKALYKNGPVVVLDEPTAALDALAEAKLYEDFDKLVNGRTSIYISHRLSSTRFCDHVAMFKDGEMVEYGTHDSLLEAGGVYSEMFNVQAKYYLEGGGENAEEYEAC